MPKTNRTAPVRSNNHYSAKIAENVAVMFECDDDLRLASLGLVGRASLRGEESSDVRNRLIDISRVSRRPNRDAGWRCCAPSLSSAEAAT